MKQTTRLAAKSIMHEAMLPCVDIQASLRHFRGLGDPEETKTPKLIGTTYK
jgi:hypothetical protein